MESNALAHVPRQGMANGPKMLLPVEQRNGRVTFALMYTDCDQMEPGTCGTTARQCATCCVPPPPPVTPEVARILLDILLRQDAAAAPETPRCATLSACGSRSTARSTT